MAIQLDIKQRTVAVGKQQSSGSKISKLMRHAWVGIIKSPLTVYAVE